MIGMAFWTPLVALICVQVFNSFTEAAKRTVTLKKRRPHHEWLSYDILKKIKEKKRFVEPMSEVS